MKRSVAIPVLVVLLMAFVGLAIWSHSATGRNDAVATFVGLINDPPQSPLVGLGEPPSPYFGGGQGLHALIAVTNRGKMYYLRFQVEGIEKRVAAGWERHSVTPFPSVFWGIWPPQRGALFAVAWPPGLETNSAWRLLLSAKREPPLVLRRVNQRLHYQLFPPFGGHCITSSVVVPAPVVETLSDAGLKH